MTQRMKFRSVAGFALIAALAALSFRSLHGNDPGGEGEPPAVTLPTAVEVLLLRAGLEPEALAAAGVSAGTLAAQLAASANALSPLPAAIAVADESYAAARVERDRLVRLIESGQGTEADLALLVGARTDLEEAEAARTGVLNDAFDAATTQMTEARRATLAQIRANAHWHVPVKYKVAARQQRAWLSIRDCLAHVRTYARHELEPLPEQTAALAAFDEDSAVATAASNLGTNLAGVQATWDASFVD